MAITLRASAEQIEALRRLAATEGRTMETVALAAIDEYIAGTAHKSKVETALNV